MDNPFSHPTILSYCPGILGLERGVKRALGSIRTLAYVEIEAFICENLLAGMEQGLVDAAPIWLNLKTFDAVPFSDRVAGIIGGYPCQPFSNAGYRKGTDDPRHLYPHIEEHIGTIRPVWCFFENVSGHLSLGFAEVRASLSDLGYAVEAGIFTAEEVGAPHERERLFILAIRRDYLEDTSSTGSWSECRAAARRAWEQDVRQGERAVGSIWTRAASELADTSGAGERRGERNLHQANGRPHGRVQQQLNGSGEEALVDDPEIGTYRLHLDEPRPANRNEYESRDSGNGEQLVNAPVVGLEGSQQQQDGPGHSSGLPTPGASAMGDTPRNYELWIRLRERGYQLSAGRPGNDQLADTEYYGHDGAEELRGGIETGDPCPQGADSAVQSEGGAGCGCGEGIQGREEVADAYSHDPGLVPGSFSSEGGADKRSMEGQAGSAGERCRDDVGDSGSCQQQTELADSDSRGHIHGKSEKLSTEGREYALGITVPGGQYEVGWPAGPGQEQHPWEEARTIGYVNRLPRSLRAMWRNSRKGFAKMLGEEIWETTDARIAGHFESSMGYAIDGYNYREDLLRAVGNSVVEQTAELAFITLLAKFK